MRVEPIVTERFKQVPLPINTGKALRNKSDFLPVDLLECDENLIWWNTNPDKKKRKIEDLRQWLTN